MGRRDLDNSLDDIIKKKRIHIDNKRDTRNYTSSRNTIDPRNLNITARRNTKSDSSRNIERRRIQKHVGNAAINSRLGGIIAPRKPHSQSRGINERPKVVGPIITSKYIGSSPEKPKERKSIDPASLVITKSVIPAQTKSQPAKKTRQPMASSTLPPITVMSPVYHRQKPIDPPVKTNIVLLCNLDPRATAEDVGETCSMFGPILSCDMLLDPMGRPLYEAEVEFMYPESAEQCVLKLDGEIADGRVLRARLQFRATPPVVPRYSSRTVGASARIEPRYHDNPPPLRYMPYSHRPY